MLGYVFNPVSFYYCYARTASCACIVAEVSNTFGERLPYLLSPDNQVADGAASPTSTTSGCTSRRSSRSSRSYRWWFTEPGDEVHVRIDVSEDGERPFHATLARPARRS